MFACLVLSVSSSPWCLVRAVACYCGIPWTFLFPFFHGDKNIYWFGPRAGFLTLPLIITDNKLITDKGYKEAKPIMNQK